MQRPVVVNTPECRSCDVPDEARAAKEMASDCYGSLGISRKVMGLECGSLASAMNN